MKKLFLILILFVAGDGLFAADPSSMHSRCNSCKNSSDFSFRLDLGLNNYLQNGVFPEENGAIYSVKPWGSWYVSVGADKISKVMGPLHLNYGGGVSWYNFKFDNSAARILKNDDGVAFFEEDMPDLVNLKSKLTATYLEAFFVPVLYLGGDKYPKREDFFEFDKPNGFRIGFGGYVGYKIDSYSKIVFKEPGDKRESDRKHSGYYLDNFRYGLRAQVGVNGVDLFANYDLNELFVPNKGPRLNAISFGLIL